MLMGVSMRGDSTPQDNVLKLYIEELSLRVITILPIIIILQPKL